MNNLTLADIKIALKDKRFRDTLPHSFKEDLFKWEKNPGCGCNVGFYKRILSEASDQIKSYYPNKTFNSNLGHEELNQDFIIKNNFYVINCSINDLEFNLKKLSPGRKQLAIARYEDQVTVLINDLDCF
jgi:hypothetical protein